MFPDYEPPEVLKSTFSQVAIVAADLDPEERALSLLVSATEYIPRRLLDQAERDIGGVYGLKRIQLQSVHPSSELYKIEPEELMNLFVAKTSMARGVLAGARWSWDNLDLGNSDFSSFLCFF